MARILILEDDDQSRIALQQILSNISTSVTVEAAADLANARLLLGDTVSFDMFLLDVNLKREDPSDASGIIFAEEVRQIKQYEFVPIVMITSVGALEIEAYRKIHCYQYIIKPYDESTVVEVVRKVLEHVRAEEKAYIIVKKAGINYKVLCEEIVYCKAIPRGVCLYLKSEQLEVPYLTIRQLLEKLPSKTFFQCHRMFVANLEYVKSYDLVNQMIYMKGYEEHIDIGVTYKMEVRKILYD